MWVLRALRDVLALGEFYSFLEHSTFLTHWDVSLASVVLERKTFEQIFNMLRKR